MRKDEHQMSNLDQYKKDLASLGSAAWPARARAARQGAFVAERNDPVSFTLEQSNQPVSLAAKRNV